MFDENVNTKDGRYKAHPEIPKNTYGRRQKRINSREVEKKVLKE